MTLLNFDFIDCFPFQTVDGLSDVDLSANSSSSGNGHLDTFSTGCAARVCQNQAFSGFFLKNLFEGKTLLPVLGLTNMSQAFLTSFLNPLKYSCSENRNNKGELLLFFLLLLFRLNIRKYSKVSEKWFSDEYGRVILHPRDEHLEIILLSSLNGGDCIILHLVTMTSYILAPTLSTARKYIFDYRDTEQICLHHWHSHVAGTILFPVDNTCSGQSTCGMSQKS